jgi:ActR/RegA family two-component response regulator
MAEFAGKRILIVEDEFVLASDLARFLESRGAMVVGPAATVGVALALVAREVLDAAVLDVNLGADRVYPVADKLIEQGVPIVFATGYDQLLIDQPYVGMPRCQKPMDKEALARILQESIDQPRSRP